MIIAAIIIVPLLAALAAYFSKSSRASRYILVTAAVIHTILSACLPAFGEPLHIFSNLELYLDDTALPVIAATTLLFLLTSLYMFSWLKEDQARENPDKSSMKHSTFIAIMLVFLTTMTLTALAQDLGTLWVAVEATTLASAPLINYRRSKTSLEAMWKYLLICSVGIGLALFGTMLIAASLNAANLGLSYDILSVVARTAKYNMMWFKAGFVFCFAGYGLKMGLAPFHTWMPDAYSEAPAPAAALISGSLVNCSFLAVIRIWEITPASLKSSCGGYLKFFGFFSLIVAAFFIIRQKDFKRMLAYSSVEHMGLLILLIAYNHHMMARLHLISHSLIKMALFLLAGNIVMCYRTQSIAQVRGLFARLPKNGALWIGGLLLICGTPPSPLFFTEWQLVTSMGIIPGTAILLLLLIIFCGMGYCMLKMTEPAAEKSAVDENVEKLHTVPGAAITLLLMLGLAIGAMFLMR
ncbi:MAG: NADH dehydrogenase FAD-containing subunit [Lentisphaerae bacterium]|nr:NADH dehydrogenase FAD-containing subunit [Lentisphaerota bacterium]